MTTNKKYGRGHGDEWRYNGNVYSSASEMIRDNDLNISLQLFGYRRRLLKSRGIEEPTAEQIINYERRPLKPAKRSLASSDKLGGKSITEYVKELETALMSLKPDYNVYTASYVAFFSELPYNLQVKELRDVNADFESTKNLKTAELIKKLNEKIKEPINN